MDDKDFIGNRAMNEYTSMGKGTYIPNKNFKQPKKVAMMISQQAPGQETPGKYVFPTEAKDKNQN